ncbi:hypothetical protein LguiB_005891 [Lonicera macranthoides]
MSDLDLSDNQIGGEIPNWIWKVGNGSLSYLNLSLNFLENLQEPYVIPDLNVLDLHSNHLRGKLPLPPRTTTYVDFSSNYFSSSIPVGIGNNIRSTYLFSVANNNLTGTIPISICNTTNLELLNMSNNSLSGPIPLCLIEWGETLGVLNLEKNRLSGNLSGTFQENCGLETLDLHDNQLEGKVPESISNCTSLELTGKIPSGNQFTTFVETSFEGNEGLCGIQLNKSCSDIAETVPMFKDKHPHPEDGKKWEFLSAASMTARARSNPRDLTDETNGWKCLSADKGCVRGQTPDFKRVTCIYPRHPQCIQMMMEKLVFKELLESSCRYPQCIYPLHPQCIRMMIEMLVFKELLEFSCRYPQYIYPWHPYCMQMMMEMLVFEELLKSSCRYPQCIYYLDPQCMRMRMKIQVFEELLESSCRYPQYLYPWHPQCM